MQLNKLNGIGSAIINAWNQNSSLKVLKFLSENYRTLLCFYFIPKFSTHAYSRLITLILNQSFVTRILYYERRYDFIMFRWINPVNFTDIKIE